ncbi:MAG: hypothetical protein EXS35_02430 [Pedosphaera sp.]|nr:hypothetical protein [Pedosphaera sp.]
MNSTPADEHKFLELVNENRNRILRVCRVYSWNSADQDDLYQEILSQIWRGLPGLKEKQFANTWLYRVAINTAISFVRILRSRLIWAAAASKARRGSAKAVDSLWLRMLRSGTKTGWRAARLACRLGTHSQM